MRNNSLLYHNQFVLGPVFIGELPLWKKAEACNGIHLTAHPDLNITQAFHRDKSLLLVGYILDPENPDYDDSTILENLVLTFSDCASLYEQTYKFGGRWVIIGCDGKETTLFNDAAGLRQVFYTDLSLVKDLWCASQPGLLAEILHLEMDADAMEFINSPEFMRNREYRFPGESSPYKEIKHLLPNHCLDLKAGSCRRYWPSGLLPRLSADDAISKAGGTLKGLLRSASSRFELVLSMTSGLDSRVVLAASRAIRDKISYMTLRQIGWADDHADISVPATLLPKLGLEHQVLNSGHILEADFISVYKKSAVLAHDVWAPDAQAIKFFYKLKKVALTGSVCEIARWSFRERLPKSKWTKTSAEDLSLVQNMGKQPFAIRHFDRWLADLGDPYNVEVLDLFEWEQGHGNWCAMCQLEFDAAWKDIFTPFNCRALLSDMLSVDEKRRRPPEYTFYMDLIKSLWPQVLMVPVNPHKKKRLLFSLRNRLRAGAALSGNRALGFLNSSCSAAKDGR